MAKKRQRNDKHDSKRNSRETGKYASVSKSKSDATKATIFVAGCGRTITVSTDLANLPDLAYDALAYPECPTCKHRVVPEHDGLEKTNKMKKTKKTEEIREARAFCVWRPHTTPHPFAALESLRDTLQE